MSALSLTVKPFRSHGLEIAPNDIYLAGAEREAWSTIVRKCVVFAFEGRATCFIESLVFGEGDKHAFVLDFRHLMARTLRQEGELIGCVQSFSPEIATALMEGMEFELGWLWLSTPGSMEDSYLQTLASAIHASKGCYEKLYTTDELLLRASDGMIMVWLNPRLSRDAIIKKLGELAKSVGWRLDVEASG